VTTAIPEASPTVRTVAAFDLDGTLTRRDTLVPFLMRVRGRGPVLRALAANTPSLARAALTAEARHRAKEALLIATLGGWWLEELQPVADAYAADVYETALRPDRVARLRWHQEQGHEVVIVSASPELYLAPLGRVLGVRAVLATGLEVDAAGRLTGRLWGDNVRGAEKVARLDAWLEGDPAEVWAYGDSDGDRELLARADHGFRRQGHGFTPV